MKIRGSKERANGEAPGAPASIVFVLASMTSLCIGSSFAKALFPVAGAAGMTGLRNGLSALLLALLFRPWRWRLGVAALRAALAYGAILGVMNLSFYLALERLPVGVAIAIEFLGPLSVAVLGASRRLDLLWIACAGAGVALLVMPGMGGAPLDPIGLGFVLVAAFCWALYIVVGQRVGQAMTGPQGVTLGLLTASLLTVPVAIASAGAVLAEPRVLLIGFVVALLCSAIPYPLELLALRRLPRPVFGVVLSLEPAIGALAGLVILHERLTSLRWLGIGVVITASVGVTLTHGPATNASRARADDPAS